MTDTGPDLGATSKPETQQLVKDALASERERQLTEEQLVDQWWDRLGLTATEGHGAEVRYVSRVQLAEALTDTAMLATEPRNDQDAGGLGRPVAALVQSLKVMGQTRAQDGAKGHEVICERAVAFIVRLTKDVTRFLEYPGLLVKHVTEERDLAVARVDTVDDGNVRVTCHPAGQPEDAHLFPLSELNVAGPVDDAVRIMVAGMVTAVTHDMIARLVGAGALEQLPEGELEPVAWLRDVDGTGSLHPAAEGDPGAFPVFGARPVDPATVHHLKAHPEYVMEPGTTHAEPDVSLEPSTGS